MRQMEDPTIWENPEQAQKLGQEKAALESLVEILSTSQESIADCVDMLELAAEEQDQELVDSIISDLDIIEQDVAGLEFKRMFSGSMDSNNAYIDVQSGSGGTEAQDWANMILRMYLRWAESNGFKTEMIELSEGEAVSYTHLTLPTKRIV